MSKHKFLSSITDMLTMNIWIGGKARYMIGDIVRLNCTSIRSKPPAHLTWYVNGESAEPNILKSYDNIVTGREGK